MSGTLLTPASSDKVTAAAASTDKKHHYQQKKSTHNSKKNAKQKIAPKHKYVFSDSSISSSLSEVDAMVAAFFDDKLTPIAAVAKNQETLSVITVELYPQRYPNHTSLGYLAPAVASASSTEARATKQQQQPSHPQLHLTQHPQQNTPHSILRNANSQR